MKKALLIIFTIGFLINLPMAMADWWKPKRSSTWQIQLNGKLNTAYRAAIYDVDLFDTPQAVINKLHRKGSKVICYFNVGGFEEWRPDAQNFPSIVLGLPLDDWPGERWLDIRQIDLLLPIIQARLDLAKAKACDGVDPDNVDGYTNNTGFPLTAQDQIDYNIRMAQEAHARNLAIGLKNDLGQVNELVANFDFAVNEQCMEYHECHLLKPFTRAKKPVFNIEYSGNPKNICNKAKQLRFNSHIKRLDLTGWRKDCQ